MENNINTTQIADRMKLAHKNALNYKKKMGKAYYLKFLEGESLTRDQAIKAKCYECVLGEDTEPCLVSTCPLMLYCQWNR